MINKSIYLVHANRLKFYADSQLHEDEELLKSIYYKDVHYIVVTKQLGLRFNDTTNVFEVQCKWCGFSSEEPTWEPFKTMRKDITDVLNIFLDAFHDMKLAQRARNSGRHQSEERNVAPKGCPRVPIRCHPTISHEGCVGVPIRCHPTSSCFPFPFYMKLIRL